MQQLITQLLNEVQYMQDKYELVKESNTDYDFYTEVIPFTEKIDKSLSKLRSFETQILSLQYMNKRKFDLLISNIEALSVECHFKRTSRKLFTEKIKAVQYDLAYILRNEWKYD
ncbi:DUF1798 family protein [Staphylococcus gallinarum]|jgi:hypothetical protein|uniref:DUF1798 family protein n=1 Tax=Staphylococcus gallinarum TaxID=1293 RepID=A0ABQ0Y170_STAGA|nr:DUF1798 family protein [Staphylococcus gallinarum]KIR11862.1 hypothetical protein SH09_05735 [Staphylococcus gallinarum]MCD8828202.1 YppE family protein [Staphylococcus gallinarum]MCD8843013.1 YppE family protein [Staphylococcus gallinarum]MCD8916880.1 YppE family protein [Staphylococcus gallinarum]MCD8919458.1 YppE family protein [Staphylococcus gallinarum]